jgi:hypothetical protein
MIWGEMVFGFFGVSPCIRLINILNSIIFLCRVDSFFNLK